MIMNEQLEFAPSVFVTEIASVKERLEYMTGETVDLHAMADEIHEHPERIHYLADNWGYRDITAKDTKYAYIDTGYKVDGEHIVISTIKARGENNFSGFFVGTLKNLMSGVLQRTESNHNIVATNMNKLKTRMDGGTVTKKTATDNIEARCEENAIIAEIEKRLLMNPFLTNDGFARYLRIIGTRIEDLIKQGKTEYYCTNNQKSVIVNTGLLDSFCQDILVMYRIHVAKGGYEIYKAISSKQDLLDEGFSMESTRIKLKAIRFTEGNEVLNANFDDFDITTHNLSHIIQERKERFDEIVGVKRPDELADKIESELKRGLMLQERDHSYAKPFYSSKTKDIAWLMPLRIETSLAEPPEFVMVIVKCQNFYQVKTVYPYDDSCKDRITAMSLYDRSW